MKRLTPMLQPGRDTFPCVRWWRLKLRDTGECVPTGERGFAGVPLAIVVNVMLALTTLAGEPAPMVAVAVHNLSAQTLRHVPLTFAQVFRQGDFTNGVTARLDGRLLATQADIQNRYADGSVRVAVLSVVLPEVPPDGSRQLALANAPEDSGHPDAVLPADLLNAGFDAVVTLRFPDGAVRSISAAKLLQQAGNQPVSWLRGPIASEWLLSGAPADADGQPDSDLLVQFQVRAYGAGHGARVSVVVENCWDTWAGNIRYDATVTVGGKEVFAATTVDHRPLARWRKVFWWGADQPPVRVTHSLPYLTATGALPHYDASLSPAPPDWQMQRDLKLEGPDWEIMGKGSLTAYMPTTGGRPEIAPYPAWAVRYLLHPEPRAGEVLLANGDLAGSWPVHVRARKTGRIMTLDERPEFWLDQRGKDKPVWQPDRHPPSPQQPRLTPDLAHQGSFAYLPYLLTGDYYYLEEAYFWANYCLLATWPHPRQNAKGILAGQTRGDAWALRNLADAAWIAATGHPEARYFDEKVRHNIADRIQRMYGPPEHSQLGFWGERTTQDARIQNPANPRWLIIAPWEHDYLLWSLHHLVELGYTDAAKPRDYLLRWRVGTFLHAPDYDPMLATPYRMVVGERTAGGRNVFYEDWQKLGEENRKLSKPELPNYGNSYAYSARAALVCGVDGGFPGAVQALRWIEEHLPNRREVMAQNPSWAIQPGGRAATARHPNRGVNP